MPDRTGIANGTLRPCIYFSRIPDMYVILAPMDYERGIELARMVYELRYKQNWVWCEATTLAEIDRLQKRLIAQEARATSEKVELNAIRRDRIFKQTGDALRQQMVSVGTTEFEKEFIRKYFALREKRDRYRDTLEHHNNFIWSRENDESKNLEDALPLMPGQYEKSGF